MQRVLKLAVGMLAAAGMVACGGATNKSAAMGGMKLGVSSAAETAVSATGTLDITGPGGYSEHYTHSIPLDYAESPCPAGNYHYTFTGTGTGGAVFEASGTFTVTAGSVTTVKILAQQVNATPMAVAAPYTKSITFVWPNQDASPSAGYGMPLQLTADVVLADNDRPDLDWFTYTWKHSCNGGEPTMVGFVWPWDIIYFDDKHVQNAAQVKTTFTSYCQGTEVITFESVNKNLALCSDEKCSLTSTVSFSIPYTKQGIAGQVTVNFAPVITCNAVVNAEPCPGGAVDIKVTGSDPDKSSPMMTYTWSSNCGGSFSGGAWSPQTTFTAPNKYDTTCVLTLKAEDHNGGFNAATVTVKTAPAALCLPMPVFNSLPSVLPPNLPSVGFEATSTVEFGDDIALAPGTDRHAIKATVAMSNWAVHSDYPSLPANGFTHPITLNLYYTDGSVIGSFTQSFLIPWRPEHVAGTCVTAAGVEDSSRWMASNGTCYGGSLSTITFNLNGTMLPDSFVYGIAYNTADYGSAPLHVAGPYNSLNFALAPALPSIGSEVTPGTVFMNSSWAGAYSDNGVGGVGIFRQDAGWTGYVPAVEFFAD